MDSRTFRLYVMRTQQAMQQVADEFEVGGLEFDDHLTFFLAEHVEVTGDSPPEVEPLPDQALAILESLLRAGPRIIDSAWAQADISYLHERQLIRPMEGTTGATVWQLTRAAQNYVTVAPKEG